jgi:hypothetical protein
MDGTAELPADHWDVVEDAMLRIILKGGWKVRESFPAEAIRPRFESKRFAGGMATAPSLPLGLRSETARQHERSFACSKGL